MKYLLPLSFACFVGCIEPPDIKQAIKEAVQELIEEEEPFFRSNGSVPPMKAYPTEYRGHTYISFNAEHGLSVVHDPDCVCHEDIPPGVKRLQLPKHLQGNMPHGDKLFEKL